MKPSIEFSGWYTMVSCFVTMFMIQGGIQCFAIFLPAISEGTGFSIGDVALISTFATGSAFCANLTVGPLMQKCGVKGTLLISLVFCFMHWITLSYAESLAMFWLGGIFAGFAIGYGTVAPCSVAMTNWFIKNRATYISIVVAGSMFGGAILMPLTGKLISMTSWQVAYRVLAFVAVGITLVFLLLFFSDSPEKKGQKAYGADEATPNAVVQENNEEGVDVPTARRSLAYWLLLLGTLLIGCSTNVENFLPAFWRSQGLSMENAANVMGGYALITAVATMILGKLNDLLGGKPYVLVTTVMFIVGTLGMLWAGVSSLPLLFLSLIPFAAGAKKTSTLTPPLVVAEAFGRKHYALLIGSFAAMLQLGIALSNVIIGQLLKLSGGYTVPFLTMAVFNVLALICVFAALSAAPFKRLTSDKVVPDRE